jgi:Protein of unknown function (DUF3606)
MVDDRAKQGESDRSLLDTGADYEFDYWTQVLGVSRERLIAAVKKVGNSTDAVKRELAA